MQMPAYTPDLLALSKCQREVEVGPSEEEVMKKACHDEATLVIEMGEGHTATTLEPSSGVTPSIFQIPSATEAILPAPAVITKPIPSTSEDFDDSGGDLTFGGVYSDSHPCSHQHSTQALVITPTTDEALLSSATRMRKRAVDRTIKSFWSFLQDIVRMVLD
ncbi:uncharacterized protein A4U43_C10F7980 [Asparagus officinalis]|uniref:Uncharacterized protein n=1 Tax=Asparagus officinalis TaxID=4686 RepID=A0A5P1E1B5_ASPOF|nr:uncharacterized protein A4U43_C10F7980 [Asparagus officinalis]